MGILSRFSDIMKANVNTLLDKAEDPEKMLTQFLLNAKEDFAKVKAETANVMAVETRAKRELDECNQGANRYGEAAKKALVAGNEDDARSLLEEKQRLEIKRANLEQAYQAAHDNAEKMRQMHDKLAEQIKEAESRLASVKAKVAVAKAQNHMNKAVGSLNSRNSLDSFSRMEEKANQMLDSANAMTELNAGSLESNKAEKLAAQYTSNVADVDDELAKMKAELGL